MLFAAIPGQPNAYGGFPFYFFQKQAMLFITPAAADKSEGVFDALFYPILGNRGHQKIVEGAI